MILFMDNKTLNSIVKIINLSSLNSKTLDIIIKIFSFFFCPPIFWPMEINEKNIDPLLIKKFKENNNQLKYYAGTRDVITRYLSFLFIFSLFIFLIYPPLLIKVIKAFLEEPIGFIFFSYVLIGSWFYCIMSYRVIIKLDNEGVHYVKFPRKRMHLLSWDKIKNVRQTSKHLGTIFISTLYCILTLDKESGLKKYIIFIVGGSGSQYGSSYYYKNINETCLFIKYKINEAKKEKQT